MPDLFWPGLRDFCEWVTSELGRIFTVSYRMDALGISCKNAEVVAAGVLTSLIDTSTS